MRFNYDRLPAEDAEQPQEQEQAAPIEMESLSGPLATSADDQQVAAVAQASADAAMVPMVEEIEAAAPPAAAAPAAAETAPPKYEDDTTSPPAYFSAAHGTSVAELYFDHDELLIEGLTVGSWFTFMCTMCGSWLFGLIGFLACFIFSTSHAGRDGAWAGFSLVMMQLSFYMREVVMYFYTPENDYSDGVPVESSGDMPTSDDEFVISAYVVASYALLAISWMTLARSLLHYCHIRRAHAAIMAAATAAVSAPRMAV